LCSQWPWILTSKTEEDRLRKGLTKAYGKPIYASEDWEVFDEGRVSLRKDKPEVMVLVDELRHEFLERLRLAGK
jgi:hypothetical protein